MEVPIEELLEEYIGKDVHIEILPVEELAASKEA
jgi:hypothetical protein